MEWPVGTGWDGGGEAGSLQPSFLDVDGPDSPWSNSTLPCNTWIGCAVGIGWADALAPSTGPAVAMHRGPIKHLRESSPLSACLGRSSRGSGEWTATDG